MIANQKTIVRSLPGIKELARRFCFSYGPNASTMCRETIVGIHQEAIRLANKSAGSQTGSRAPANLSFLETITGLSPMLLPQEKKLIRTKLDKTFAKRAKPSIDDWLPYYALRKSCSDDPNSAQVSQGDQNGTAVNNAEKNTDSTIKSDANLMPPPPLDTDLSSTRNSDQRKRKRNHSIGKKTCFKYSQYLKQYCSMADLLI
jgi:hypothetical protein